MTAMTKNIKCVLLDTSSCLHDKAGTVIPNDLFAKSRTGNIRLVVAKSVLEELNKHAQGDKPNLQRNAREILRVLVEGKKQGLVEFFGDPDDQFADALFQTVITKHRTRFPLELVTQDVSLMHDVLELATPRSVEQVYPVTVQTIDEKGGFLRPVTREEVARRLAFQDNKRKHLEQFIPEGSDHPPFSEGSGVVTDQTIIPVTRESLGEGVTLVSDKGARITLGRPLARGGEGVVHYTSMDGYLAKIYLQKARTKEREAKITRMIEHGLDPQNTLVDSICWPLDILRDQEGNFRGILMKHAPGQVLYNTVMIGTNLRKAFPDWDRRHLARLCIAILQRVHFLHQANILIGDINPGNILVAGPEEVYFLDTDSYQIEDWVCPVGTAHFTPPELQGANFREVRRTKEHERFAVATLLFMILHAGKQPYAQVGATDPASNIRNGKFPYRFAEGDYDSPPPGPWLHIWSNLSYRVKEAFYQSFHVKHKGERRIRIRNWIDVMTKWLYHLENHDVDPQELALFPTRCKRLSRHARDTYHPDSSTRNRMFH